MARQNTPILERFLGPVAAKLNPSAARALAAHQIDPVIQRRISRLASLANEGNLTPAERDEYETYIVANDLVSILRLRAAKQKSKTTR